MPRQSLTLLLGELRYPSLVQHRARRRQGFPSRPRSPDLIGLDHDLVIAVSFRDEDRLVQYPHRGLELVQHGERRSAVEQRGRIYIGRDARGAAEPPELSDCPMHRRRISTSRFRNGEAAKRRENDANGERSTQHTRQDVRGDRRLARLEQQLTDALEDLRFRNGIAYDCRYASRPWRSASSNSCRAPAVIIKPV